MPTKANPGMVDAFTSHAAFTAITGTVVGTGTVHVRRDPFENMSQS